MDETKDLLEKLLTAQVLEMAAAEKHRRKSGISQTSSDLISETVQEICKSQQKIVRLVKKQI